MSKAQTGHAVIQLTPEGQNCIIISSGANDEIQEEYIDEVLKHFSPGDFLLLQNETSNVAYAMRRAKEKGMRIVFNASPVDERMKTYPLELVDYFLSMKWRDVSWRTAKRFPKANMERSLKRYS